MLWLPKQLQARGPTSLEWRTGQFGCSFILNFCFGSVVFSPLVLWFGTPRAVSCNIPRFEIAATAATNSIPRSANAVICHLHNCQELLELHFSYS